MRWARQDKRQWHDRFAWLPTPTVDGVWVWLETIEQRRVNLGIWTEVYEWQHRIKREDRK